MNGWEGKETTLLQNGFCCRDALVAIQRAVRHQVQLKCWPWYRLWLKVRQLIPLVAERRRLAQLEEDNKEMAAQLEESQRLLQKAQRELTDGRLAKLIRNLFGHSLKRIQLNFRIQKEKQSIN